MSYKHLKLRGIYDPNTTKVTVQVVEMTAHMHRSRETFSEKYCPYRPEISRCQFLASNGVRLKVDSGFVRGIDNTYVHPSEFNGIFTVYMPNDEYELSQWYFVVPLANWGHIKQAVKEYNEFHSE